MAGTVIKRTHPPSARHPNGLVRWRAVLPLPPDPVTGKRRMRRQDFGARREAQAALAQWQVEQRQGTLVDRSDQTVAAMMAYWLDTHARHKRPTTFEGYSLTVRLHVIPHLGAVKVQDLTVRQVQQWWTDLLKAGKGRRTVRLAHLHLKQALDQAMDLGTVGRNVATRVPPPAPEVREMETWTPEEADTFLATADDHGAYGPIWHVFLSTGMRRGEALGLRWRDIDWQSKVLHVRQALVVLNNRPALGPPKTKKARRDIPVDDGLLDVLRAHRARQTERRLAMGALWQTNDLVFAAEGGMPIRPRNLLRDYEKLITLAGVRRIRIHDERHTWVTWALEEGAALGAVSRMAGHANPAITMNLYGHVTPRMEREVVDKVARRRAPSRDSG